MARSRAFQLKVDLKNTEKLRNRDSFSKRVYGQRVYLHPKNKKSLKRSPIVDLTLSFHVIMTSLWLLMSLFIFQPYSFFDRPKSRCPSPNGEHVSFTDQVSSQNFEKFLRVCLSKFQIS